MSQVESILVVLLVIGITFNAVGIIGLFRFPDVYSRLHAETKTTTFGTIFTSLSVVIYALYQYFSAQDPGGLNFAAHILVAIVVLAFTNATGSHAIANSAYARGQKPLNAVIDRLAERQSVSTTEETK